MRLALACLVSLAAAWTAGCVGAPGESMTMRDGLADARDAAADWGDGLRLASAHAVEPFKRIQETGDDGRVREEWVTHLDGSPGDGRAPGWLYHFLAADGRCVTVVLAAGLGVLAEGFEECGDGEAEALPAVVLDSDEVAAILRGEPGWPAGEATTTMWGLSVEDGRAAWSVWAGNGTAYAAATVDAVTGEVTEIEEDEAEPGAGRPGDGGIAGQGATSFGSAPLVTPATPFDLEVDLEGPGSLHVSAMVAEAVGGVRLVVEGPEGVLLDEPMGSTHDASLDDLPAGPYTCSIVADGAAVQATLSVTAFWWSG